MVSVIFALAMCGVAGGYLAAYSTLWEDFREKFKRSQKKSYEAFLNDFGWKRWLKLLQGKVSEALVCAVCFGWHANWVSLAVWELGGEGTGLDTGGNFVAWFAACGLSTLIMKVSDKAGLWKVEGR